MSVVNGKGIFVPASLGALEGLRATKGRGASSYTSVAVGGRWVHERWLLRKKKAPDDCSSGALEC